MGYTVAPAMIRCAVAAREAGVFDANSVESDGGV